MPFLPFDFFHPWKISYLKHTAHVSQRISVVGLVVVCVFWGVGGGGSREGGAIHTKLLLQNAQ